jgi:hypothetical protein
MSSLPPCDPDPLPRVKPAEVRAAEIIAASLDRIAEAVNRVAGEIAARGDEAP